MILAWTLRLLREVKPRLLWRFAHHFGWRSLWAVERYKRRVRRGEWFPPFLFVSVTTRCNLRCQGCWIPHDGAPVDMAGDKLDRLLAAAEAEGIPFFGILGGEPLLHSELLDVLARHPRSYFQLFTNGALLDDAVAARLAELGNVTPLISVEGSEAVSDERRGGEQVHARAMAGLEACRRHGLVTGVAASLCKSNIDDFLREDYLRTLIDRGVHYLWYYIYRPVGPDPTPALALSREEILRARRFLVEMRSRVPLLLVDAYWDADGRALCPAAAGMSVHVNPQGMVEPCPPFQYACDRIDTGDDLGEALRSSAFLPAVRKHLSETTRGCILIEHPRALAGFLREQDACDTSGRDGWAELACRCPVASHHLPGDEIPETHPLYRFAKKHWFFGFGAYG